MSDVLGPADGIPFLEGNQISLRAVRPADATGNYQQWLNDSKVTKYLESRFFPTAHTAIEEFIEEQNTSDDVLFLAIVENEDRIHIGNVKLGPIDWIHRRGDLGILIGEREYWGRGIATETIELIVEHAFRTLNLHKVTAGCYTTNPASKRAFQKVGFTNEGVRADHAYCDGKYVDVELLGLCRPDFEG